MSACRSRGSKRGRHGASSIVRAAATPPSRPWHDRQFSRAHAICCGVCGMVGGQMAALLAAAITLLQTGIFHFAGLAQLVNDRPDQTGSLTVDGFYAWVRHPLYTFSLIFLWLTPSMNSNSLTAYILFSLYFYLGSFYEERRLIEQFGPVYERYQQQVPRLIPIPGRRYVAQNQQVSS